MNTVITQYSKVRLYVFCIVFALPCELSCMVTSIRQSVARLIVKLYCEKLRTACKRLGLHNFFC